MSINNIKNIQKYTGNHEYLSSHTLISINDAIPNST